MRPTVSAVFPARLSIVPIVLILALLAARPTVCLGGATEFRRGDSNTDGRVDVSDAVGTLGTLFLGGDALVCEDAADADDSGALDITDAVFTLGFLFLGGRAPGDPGPVTCGADPTGDGLDCASYPLCDGEPPPPTDPVAQTLSSLGVGMEAANRLRVDELDTELEDFSPLGTLVTMNRPEEIFLLDVPFRGFEESVIDLVGTRESEPFRQDAAVLRGVASTTEWQHAPTRLDDPPLRHRHAAAGDIDGDGLDEIVIAYILSFDPERGGESTIRLAIIEDEDQGLAAAAPETFILQTLFVDLADTDVTVATGDFDGDSVAEIAVAAQGAVSIYRFERPLCEQAAFEEYDECIRDPDCLSAPDPAAVAACEFGCGAREAVESAQCNLNPFDRAACLRRARERAQACRDACDNPVNTCVAACREIRDERLAECDRAPLVRIHRQSSFNDQGTWCLAVGNVDRDAAEELVILKNQYFTNLGSSVFEVLDDANHGFAEMRRGRAFYVDIPFRENPTTSTRASEVALGDVDGDGVDEIVLGGLLNPHPFLPLPGPSCEGTQYVLQVLDDARTGFAEISAQVTDPVFLNNCEDFQPFLVNHTFVNTADLDGDGRDEIQVNQLVFDDFAFGAWLPLAFLGTDPVPVEDPDPTDRRLRFAGLFPESFLDRDTGPWRLDRSTVSVAVGKVAGDGREKILVYAQGRPSVDITGVDPAQGWRTLRRNDNSASVPVDSQPNLEFATHPLLVPVNATKDTGTTLRFVPGSQRVVYTEPIVHAVFAAPPCYGPDVQNLLDCETRYAQEQSDSSVTTDTVEVFAALHVGYDGDFQILGVGAKVELEATIRASISHAIATTYETSVTFSTESGSDTVICSTTPYDQYDYEIVSAPAGSEHRIGEIVQVSLPRRPIDISTDRETYNASIADDALRIGPGVLAHTVGDPFSYPRSARQWVDGSPSRSQLIATPDTIDVVRGSGGPSGGGDRTTLEIGVHQSEGTEYEISAELSVRTSLNGVMGGFSIGAGASRNMTHTVGTRTIYEGSIGWINPDAPAEIVGYRSKLFTYLQRIAGTGQEFEVINYEVTGL